MEVASGSGNLTMQNPTLQTPQDQRNALLEFTEIRNTIFRIREIHVDVSEKYILMNQRHTMKPASNTVQNPTIQAPITDVIYFPAKMLEFVNSFD